MKVIHINYSDNKGGAAKAAYRLHRSLLEFKVNSIMFVNSSEKEDSSVIEVNSLFYKYIQRVKLKFSHFIAKFFLKTDNKIIHSLSIFPSAYVKKINSSDADIVHLHWFQGETISIKDIAKIKKPIIWTLHDMWGFCGSEHISYDNRYLDGYLKTNRPHHESGFDINRWTWLRKLKYWKRPITIVTPSSWLNSSAKNSYLMKNWLIKRIPNCIDLNFWKPVNQNFSREIFNIPKDKKIILFGGAENDAYHKGFDLFKESMETLKNFNLNIEIVIFGNSNSESLSNLAIPVRYIGILNDEFSLKALYSAADVTVIPSRQDNLPNVAIESQSCGTPVVAFRIGGLPDIVEHKKTGYLCNEFDTSDFAKGIRWVLDQDKTKLRNNAVQKINSNFSSKEVIKLYKALYKKTINEFRK